MSAITIVCLLGELLLIVGLIKYVTVLDKKLNSLDCVIYEYLKERHNEEVAKAHKEEL